MRCGLLVVGVLNEATGVITASDRSRPEPGAAPIDGVCTTCLDAMQHLAEQDRGKAEQPSLDL